MNPLLQLIEQLRRLDAIQQLHSRTAYTGLPLGTEGELPAESAAESAYGLGPVLLDDPGDSKVEELLGWIAQHKGELRKEIARERLEKKRSRTAASPLPPLTERLQHIAQLCTDLGNKPASTMTCFIMYDISDNKVRKKVSEYLIERGCVRVQKSIFMAQLERRIYHELQDALHTIQQAYENEDSILFVPVAESEVRSIRVIGREIDASFVLRRKHTLFF